MHIVLETERMLLRRFTETDIDNLFALDSDPEVMRYLTGGAGTPREIIENDILPGFLRSYDSADMFGVWPALEKESMEFLGWFAFRPEDVAHPDTVSLGYRVRRKYWGKGYATEGVRALIYRGFTVPGVRRIVATTYQDNLASRRVMEKAGMRLVRSYRLTPADLLASSTFHTTTPEIWDGDDVEYELLKM